MSISFKEVIKRLGIKGKILSIEQEVDPDIEAPLLFKKMAEKSEKAVVVLNPKEKNIPLISNIYWKKGGIIFGERIVDKLDETVKKALKRSEFIPTKFFERLHTITSLALYANYIPKVVDSAPFMNIVYTGYDADLTKFPALRHCEEEENHVVVNPLIIAVSKELKKNIVGVHRIQIVDEKTLSIHVPRISALYDLLEEALQKHSEVKTAIVIGGPPALQIAATPPSPPNIDKYFLAGIIQNSPLNLVKLNEDLFVPSESEIVIEGVIEPGDTHPEGKMLYEDGYLYGGDPAPIMRIKNIYMRNDALFYTSITHHKHSDQTYLTYLASRVTLGYLKTIYNNIVDFHVPSETLGRVAFVSIKKQRVGEARELGASLLGLKLTPYLETIVVFNEDVNIHDPVDVLKELSANTDLDRDILRISNQQASELEPSGSHIKTKIIIDATRKIQGEVQTWPERPGMDSQSYVDALNKVLSILQNVI
ncbi:MAG: hypothetical protein DRJ35_00430 [Thermoprotei archaeon]|nr:MAG: hypothetical protein DRJ35_00430 [Thermoprotei archaeon]